MEIAVLLGKPNPETWFYDLEREDQVRWLGWYRVHKNPAGPPAEDA